MGHSAVPMILSIIGTVGTRIFWIYGVFPMHRSLMVLFLSYPASWTVTILLQAVCFYFVRKKYTVPCRRKKHKNIRQAAAECGRLVTAKHRQ